MSVFYGLRWNTFSSNPVSRGEPSPSDSIKSLKLGGVFAHQSTCNLHTGERFCHEKRGIPTKI
jgi:hypothetical protein